MRKAASPKNRETDKRLEAPSYTSPKRRFSHLDEGAVLSSKPKPFSGKPLAGSPPEAEVRKAAQQGTLKVNRKGYVTTPKVRKAAGAVSRIQKRARKRRSSGDLPHLEGAAERNARTVLRRGERAAATPKEKLAAIETGLVESGFKNYTNQTETDADSLGWRQERTSIYGTGPTGPTNVKASADRFFREVRTDAGTETAPTPGLLAQAAQGSAFPERYDEREAEAKAILTAYETGKLKPNERKKLAKAKKQARKLGLKAGEKKSETTLRAKKLKGAWAGTRSIALRAAKGLAITSKKRTPAENVAVGGATESDHLTTKKDAFAVDMPATGAELDSIAGKLHKRLKLREPLAVGTYNWYTSEKYPGYRFQILAHVEGHEDHAHLGVEWTGEDLPPGTYLGGTGYGGTSYAGASSGEVSSYAQATGQSVAAVKNKLRKGRLSGFEVIEKLESLGLGYGLAPSAAASRESASRGTTLATLERKYL